MMYNYGKNVRPKGRMCSKDQGKIMPGVDDELHSYANKKK